MNAGIESSPGAQVSTISSRERLGPARRISPDILRRAHGVCGICTWLGSTAHRHDGSLGLGQRVAARLREASAILGLDGGSLVQLHAAHRLELLSPGLRERGGRPCWRLEARRHVSSQLRSMGRHIATRLDAEFQPVGAQVQRQLGAAQHVAVDGIPRPAID